MEIDLSQWKTNEALHDAAETGTSAEVEEALANGANINGQDWEGQRPLHKAVQGRRFPIVRTLIARGAKINAKDRDGRTALHYAMNLPDSGMTLLILSHPEVDTHIRDKVGKTAWQVAQSRRDSLNLDPAAKRLFLNGAMRVGAVRLVRVLEPHLERVERLANRLESHAVFLDVEPDPQTSYNGNVVLRVEGRHANQLAGFLAEALAGAGARSVCMSPAAYPLHRPICSEKQPRFGVATLRFDGQGLNSALFGSLVDCGIRALQVKGTDIAEECRKAHELEKGFSGTLAFPSLGRCTLMLVTHNRGLFESVREQFSQSRVLGDAANIKDVSWLEFKIDWEENRDRHSSRQTGRLSALSLADALGEDVVFAGMELQNVVERIRHNQARDGRAR